MKWLANDIGIDWNEASDYAIYFKRIGLVELTMGGPDAHVWLLPEAEPEVERIILARERTPDSSVNRGGQAAQTVPQESVCSCVISYSTKDQALADRLRLDLSAKGVRCWLASSDLKGGRKLHEQIGEAIRAHDRLLLVLSEDSMGSEWVKTEIAEARQIELREKRRVLFPIRLVPFAQIKAWKCFDADTGKDSAREIREYFIPDFSDWRDEAAYAQAFQGLLRDLKAEGQQTDGRGKRA